MLSRRNSRCMYVHVLTIFCRESEIQNTAVLFPAKILFVRGACQKTHRCGRQARTHTANLTVSPCSSFVRPSTPSLRFPRTTDIVLHFVPGRSRYPSGPTHGVNRESPIRQSVITVLCDRSREKAKLMTKLRRNGVQDGEPLLCHQAFRY